MSQESASDPIQSYFESIELQREEVTTIVTPPFLPSFAAVFIEILAGHNVRVDVKTNSCLVHFPAGSSKTELLPRVYDERYRIALPDGFELYEVRRRGMTQSYLQCVVSTLTPEQQRNLKASSPF